MSVLANVIPNNIEPTTISKTVKPIAIVYENNISKFIQTSAISSITIFGLAVLIMYSITKILNFYGYGVDVYGSYLAFYIFLLIAAFTLNRNYPQF